MDILLTVINVACAGLTLKIGSEVLLHVYQWRDRVDSIDGRIQKLQGALGNAVRSERDEIRDAVDTYLASMDIKAGGGGDMMEQLLPVLMSSMFGGAGPGPGDSRAPGDEEDSMPSVGMLGSGGSAESNGRD